MTRTPEQVKADDELRAAIENVHQAYDDVEGVLTKYVVLAQRQWFDDDGDRVTTNWANPSDGCVPISDLLGLVEYAAARYRRAITDDDDD